MICRVQPESPYRDLSCFARTYSKMTETCVKKNVFRNDSPECATDTSGNVLWEIRHTLYRILLSFWPFSDRLFVVF